MVESAFEFADICRDADYHNFLFSMKASNPLVMVQVRLAEGFGTLVSHMKPASQCCWERRAHEFCDAGLVVVPHAPDHKHAYILAVKAPCDMHRRTGCLLRSSITAAGTTRSISA